MFVNGKKFRRGFWLLKRGPVYWHFSELEANKDTQIQIHQILSIALFLSNQSML